MAKYAPGPKAAKITSLIGYWPLFRSALDASGNGNNGVISNAVLSPGRTGIENASFEFNGSDSMITVPFSSVLSPTNITIIVWAKVNLGTPGMELVTKEFQPSSPFFDYALQINEGAAGLIRFWLTIAGATEILTYTDASLIGGWHQYAATYNGSTQKILVDGILKNSRSASGNIDQHDVDLLFGNNPRSADPLDGNESEILIFSEGLPDATILELYNQFVVQKGSNRGNVFQESGQSFSIRTRRKPLFHRTVRTSKSRSKFGSVQSTYRLLDSTQKTSWSDQTPNFTRVNSLGNVYELSGPQLFGSQNKALATAGLPQVQTASAPVTYPNPSFSSRFFQANPIDIRIVTNPEIVPADFQYQMLASRALLSDPSDVNNVETIQMITFDESESTNVNWGAQWEEQFGSAINSVGLVALLQMDIISKLTGQKITKFQFVVEIS